MRFFVRGREALDLPYGEYSTSMSAVIDAVDCPDVWDEEHPGSLKETLVANWRGLKEWRTICTEEEWTATMIAVEEAGCPGIEIWIEGDDRFASTFAEPE